MGAGLPWPGGPTARAASPVCPVDGAATGADELHRRDLPGRPVWVRRCGACGACDLRSFWARPDLVAGPRWACRSCSGMAFAAHQVWMPHHQHHP